MSGCYRASHQAVHPCGSRQDKRREHGHESAHVSATALRGWTWSEDGSVSSHWSRTLSAGDAGVGGECGDNGSPTWDYSRCVRANGEAQRATERCEGTNGATRRRLARLIVLPRMVGQLEATPAPGGLPPVPRSRQIPTPLSARIRRPGATGYVSASRRRLAAGAALELRGCGVVSDWWVSQPGLAEPRPFIHVPMCSLDASS
jgi:hypothetical protein